MIFKTYTMGGVLRYEVIQPFKKDYLNDEGRYGAVLNKDERRITRKILEYMIDFEFKLSDHEVEILEKGLYYFWRKHSNLLKKAQTSMSEWKNKEMTKIILPEPGT